MKVIDLKRYIENHVPYKYVVNFFHNETPDNVCSVVLSSAGRSSRNTGEYLFQFLVRNVDPEQAEKISHDIYNHFNNKTGFEIGGTKVIMSRGQQALALYTGVDEVSRHIYSVNIVAVTDRVN